MTDLNPTQDRSWVPAPLEKLDDDAALASVRDVIDSGPYSDDWDSLTNYEIPRWYSEAKFGIFLHWGVYSVPAFGDEWYPRRMHKQRSPAFEHHRSTYGEHADFGYKDFIPSFTMDKFDPDAWAQLFRQAGAQFVVPVAEHHDGFTMYDSERTRWKASAMGPRRDVFGDLGEATRRQWMVLGASSHRAEHWFFMNGGAKFDSDVLDPAYADFYGPAQREELAPNEQYLDDWLLRTVEIIDTYRPQLLWFDWWIEEPAFEPYLRKLAAYYYNRAAEWGREVVINYKWRAFRPGSAVYDIERGAMKSVQPEIWQSDTAVSKTSWSWVEGHQYKSVVNLIDELVDTVAKNGVLLLNLGPKADGTIPDEEQEMLRAIGRWLAVHGEAIFGTVPFAVAGEGPTPDAGGSFVDENMADTTAEDFRFTMRHDMAGSYLYVTTTAWPDDDTLRVRTLGAGQPLLTYDIENVTMLGSSAEIDYSRGVEALEVRLPAERPSEYGVTLKVWLAPEKAQPRHDSLH